MISRRKALASSLLLLLAALLWGTNFVAQKKGMDFVDPFTYNAARSYLGTLVLIPVALIFTRKKSRAMKLEEPLKYADYKRDTIIGGFFCGLCMFGASTCQQFGLLFTSPGKSGFITTLYIIIVPILGIFIGKKIGAKIWVCVAIAVVGMYFLCINESISIGSGEVLTFVGAIIFALHILVTDRYAPRVNPIFMSAMQFLAHGSISLVLAFIFEDPSLAAIKGAAFTIAYAGIMSSGIAFTIQIVVQKNINPTVASLLMSFESVFSVLGAWVIMGDVMSGREALGCVLMFIAVILSQLPDRAPKKQLE